MTEKEDYTIGREATHVRSRLLRLSFLPFSKSNFMEQKMAHLADPKGSILISLRFVSFPLDLFSMFVECVRTALCIVIITTIYIQISIWVNGLFLPFFQLERYYRLLKKEGNKGFSNYRTRHR